MAIFRDGKEYNMFRAENLILSRSFCKYLFNSEGESLDKEMYKVLSSDDPYEYYKKHFNMVL